MPRCQDRRSHPRWFLYSAANMNKPCELPGNSGIGRYLRTSESGPTFPHGKCVKGGTQPHTADFAQPESEYSYGLHIVLKCQVMKLMQHLRAIPFELGYDFYFFCPRLEAV